MTFFVKGSQTLQRLQDISCSRGRGNKKSFLKSFALEVISKG